MRVCGAQMAVTRDVRLNVQAILGAVEHAKRGGANVLLTPEGSLSGYAAHFDQDVVRRGLDEVTSVARQAGIALALGTCFVETDGLCHNQVRFYDQSGTFLGFHSKRLLCGNLDEPPQGEVNDFAVSPLTTFDLDGVRVGALICNDLWANPGCTPMDDPHLTHVLARMGARVIFHAVNGGRDGGEWSRVAWRYHEANLRMRARASGVWIVTADSAHPIHIPCSAPSGIVGPDGEWALTTEPQGERYFIGDVKVN